MQIKQLKKSMEIDVNNPYKYKKTPIKDFYSGFYVQSPVYAMLNGKRSSLNLNDGKLNNGVSGKMIRKGEYTFIHYKSNIFTKVISLKEVEKLFLIHSFAK